MGKLIFFALLASGAWLFFNKLDVAGLDPRGVGTRLEGSSVVRDTSQIETRFARVSSVEDTYVLFGGDAAQRRNQATHASFAGLPLRYAQAIAGRHPDFYMCKSPGAAEAQRLTESVNVVAAEVSWATLSSCSRSAWPRAASAPASTSRVPPWPWIRCA